MCDFRAAFLRRRASSKTEPKDVPPRSLAPGRAHASNPPINIEGRGQAGLRAWEIRWSRAQVVQWNAGRGELSGRRSMAWRQLRVSPARGGSLVVWITGREGMRLGN